MNRIEQLFATKKANILNIYFTAGYPERDDTEKVILALEKYGADLIEIGMPYSDPLADGPTIQASGTKAIENGMTIPLLFTQIEAVRKQTNIPLVLMGYFNQVMQYGVESFLKKCKEVGVDGLILPDLPLYEYETSYRELVEDSGLGISFLISPQTSEERIKKIDELSKGFVYVVSSAAITGAKSDIQSGQITYFKRLAAMGLKTPQLIGFGIHDAKTFQSACRYSNGAIIGSAFIRALTEKGGIDDKVKDFLDGVLKKK